MPDQTETTKKAKKNQNAPEIFSEAFKKAAKGPSPEALSTKPPAPITKKTHPTKPSIIMAVILIPILTGILLLSSINPGIFTSTRTKVFRSLQYLFLPDPDQSHIPNLTALLQMLTSDTVETDFSLVIQDGYPESLRDFGIRMNISHDKINRKWNTEFGLIVTKMDALTGNLYLDDHIAALSIPEMTNRLITINNTGKLPANIDHTYLSQSLGAYRIESAKNMLDLIKAILFPSSDKASKSTLTRFEQKTNALTTLKNSILIEKTDAKTYLLDNKEQLCPGYSITVQNTSIAEFIQSLQEFMSQDQILPNQFSQWDHFLRIFSNAAEETENNLEDIHIQLYTNKKGHPVNINLETNVTWKDRLYDIKLQSSFQSSKTNGRQAEGIIIITSGSSSSSVAFKTSRYINNESAVSESQLIFGGRQQKLGSFTYLSQYNTSEQTFQINMSVDSLGTLESSGIITEYKKGKSIKAEIDTLRYYNPSHQMITELIGVFSIQPLKDKITVPAGEPFDIIKADEKEWEYLIDEINQFINNYKAYTISY